MTARGRQKNRSLSKERRAAAIQRWEQAGRPPCEVCGTPVGKDEAIQVDHIVMRAQHGTDDLDNLRVIHSVCNNARNGQSVVMVQLLRARQLGITTFKAGPMSHHTGHHIDVAASFRNGKLTRCPRSRSPLEWLRRSRSTRRVNKAQRAAEERLRRDPAHMAEQAAWASAVDRALKAPEHPGHPEQED